jgi:uncharacterized integral membrane protein (TIGR00698 family)
VPNIVISVVILAVLALLTNRLVAVSPKALEYPLWAVVLGLGANLALSVAGVREKVNQAFRTELFLKVGLVLLGAGVNFTQVLSVGAKGVVQAVIMVTAVFLFTWWLGGVLKLDKKLRALMSTAISICGVSAAIAAAGAVLAKKEHLAYVTTLVIITSLPLMILMPYTAIALGLSPDWAGAWFGGNIDTTAAVVGAGALHSEAAMKVASIVKMSQNALIGAAAFLLASYWVIAVERKPGERPSARVIWDRFPKFVLGFILISILASVGLFSKAQLADLTALRNWAFTLAFISIGLELSFGELKRTGARPLVAYLIATVFNTLLALGVAAVIFGGIAGF